MSPLKNILITGATGYIGSRLSAEILREPGTRLRLLVRDRRRAPYPPSERVEILEGDTLDRPSLDRAASGMDTAYYLVHSMGARGDFQALDRTSALNFREACIGGSVRRIIYLGGLGNRDTASPHLLSRIETGQILSARPDRIQTIWFRAGIIIGAGSASFEITKALVRKLPVMITPRFVMTRTQPVAVGDVLRYLLQAKELDVRESLVVDIGSERMSFRSMLMRTARAMRLKRLLIPVPVFTPRLSSYWMVFITAVPFRIARSLVEGLKSETVMENDNAAKFFPGIRPMSFDEAVREALEEGQKSGR